MNRWIASFVVVVLSFAPLGCGTKHDSSKKADEIPSFAITQWGKTTELFVEHKALVVNRETSFAAHLTILENYKPVTEAKVTLSFSGTADESFSTDTVDVPGIFRPIANVSKPGKYALKLSIEGPGIEDVFDLGEVEVFGSVADAKKMHVEEEESAGIPFLKEQQWKTDFMVAEVQEKELSESLKANGQVIAPQGSYIVVTSPASGTLGGGVNGPALFRAYVKKDEKLGTIKTTSNGSVDIVSPVSGIVSRVHSGNEVQSGAKLFEIVNLSLVWIEASVYEPDIADVSDSSEALIEIPGSDTQIKTKRLVGEGGIFNASSRTLPMIFEVENENNSLRVGSAVTVFIKKAARFKGLVVPKEALLDEGGRYVVYVMKEGESFERREVIPAVREGSWIGIKEGLKEGERVATKGAYFVRLAASSSQIPAHGHAH